MAQHESMPDSQEANKLGCSCPVGPNNKGAGMLMDGVRSWEINPACPLHANPKWWLSRSRRYRCA